MWWSILFLIISIGLTILFMVLSNSEYCIPLVFAAWMFAVYFTIFDNEITKNRNEGYLVRSATEYKVDTITTVTNGDTTKVSYKLYYKNE